ncbi:MAG: hypothetical protein QOG87_1482 [Actinomycetota bacterium]
MTQDRPDEPGLFGRLVAHLHGEVAADALEAYRRAGAGVFALTDDLDRLRLEAVVHADGPWEAPPAAKTALLCGWNALALQIMGDQLLEADYRCEPRTVGFVVPETAEQALAYYSQVAGWLSRAMQAIHNPNYDLDASVPAPLPPWVNRPDCPDAYLEGLLDGLHRLRVHAEGALGDFRRTCGTEQPHALARVEGIAAEAAAATDYADGLGGARADEVRTEVLAQIRVGIERYYLLGQLVAMPHLATKPLPKPTRSAPPSAPRALPRPGQKGFDPWCLSDPRIVKSLKKIRAAQSAIDDMWAADTDPNKTLAIRADIDAGLYRDDIAYDSSHYFACPWSAVYVAKRPVRVGVVTVQPLQTFTVTIDMGGRGQRFRRQVLIGSFYRAGRVKYWSKSPVSHD